MTGKPRWDTSVDERLDILRLVLYGVFDLEAWMEVLDTIPSTNGFRPNLSSIVDAREARLDFFYNDAQRLLELIRLYLPQRGSAFRSAWVVNLAVDYGTTRMVQAVLDELPFKSAVFKQMEQAEAWITAGPQS